MASGYINIPQSPFVDTATGKVTKEWLEWLIRPNFLSVDLGSAIGPESGGTGLTAAPSLGALLVGNGATYSLSVTLPTSAMPALTGDATSSAGSTVTTLATVNANTGPWGTGTQVATITLDGKGRATAASNTDITGSPGAFTAGGSITATGAFGCNSKTAQTAAASGAAVATTAATNAAPFGYTTAAQADRIVALLNTIQAALIANGILS